MSGLNEKRELDNEAEETLDAEPNKRQRTDEPVNDSTNDPDRAEEQDGTSNDASTSRLMVKLSNVNKHVTSKDLKKFLSNQHQLEPLRIKKVHGMMFAELYFQGDAEAHVAHAKLNGVSFRNSELSSEVVNKVEQQAAKLEKHQQRAQQRQQKQPDVNDTRTPLERINDQVTPLWRKPYEQQLQEKTARFRKGLSNLKRKLLEFLSSRDVQPERKNDLRWVQSQPKGVVCPLEDTVPSPLIDKYRNKCEFSFGVDLEGNLCLGFLLGLFRDGITNVLSPEGCPNVSDKAIKIAKAMQDHAIRSGLEAYNRETHLGFWRLVQVRTHETGECMLIIQVNPKNMDEASIKAQREALISCFNSMNADMGLNITTALWQLCEGVHNGISDKFPMDVIFGDGHVHEELLGVRFRISPSAFFQVNTKATELLYSRVRDWCSLDQMQQLIPTTTTDTTETSTSSETSTTTTAGSSGGVVVLDLCCGTGTIGITIAKQGLVKRVIGVDIVEEAIHDARANAVANGIRVVEFPRIYIDIAANAGGDKAKDEEKEEEVGAGMQDVVVDSEPGVTQATYLAGRVEDVIRRVVAAPNVVERDVVVAVLDPARSGVGADVIKSVRACDKVKKVVYVSCDFDQAMQNFVEPVSNKFKGTPFKLVRAVPFDLFPHTSHCELLVELERV